MKEVMTGKKVIYITILSVFSLVFGLIAILGFTGDEYVYLP